MRKATLSFRMNEWEEMEQLEQLIRTSSVPEIPNSEEEFVAQPQALKRKDSQRFRTISTVCASVIIGLLLGLSIISIFAPIALKK